jgi:hypothetical protein
VLENGYSPAPSTSQLYPRTGGNATLANLQVDGTASFNGVRYVWYGELQRAEGVVTATVRSGNLTKLRAY